MKRDGPAYLLTVIYIAIFVTAIFVLLIIKL